VKRNDESDAENGPSDNPSDSGDSSDTSGDRQCAKKMMKVIELATISTTTDIDGMQKKSSKTKGGKKIMKETALNRDVDEKIKLLQSRWECSKGGCSTDHCFIHPENSEHIPLSHNHFAIWAAAWVCTFFYLLVTLIHLRSATRPPICRLGEAAKSHQVQQLSFRSTWRNLASTPTVHQ